MCVSVCVPVGVCVVEQKITLTVASQREPWALKLRRRGRTDSQKAVLLSTAVCSPSLDSASASHSPSLSHTHPSSWEVPGGTEALWLIRSQVKHCPGACYKAKVNDDARTHTHIPLPYTYRHAFSQRTHPCAHAHCLNQTAAHTVCSPLGFPCIVYDIMTLFPLFAG